jgi:hypothetical protein
MEDPRITAAELEAELQAEVRVLAEKMATAINTARLGKIIADSEEAVRDAHAVFREQAYQRVLDLLQAKRQGAFSPSAVPAGGGVAAQGPTGDLASDGERAGAGGSGGVLERGVRVGGAGGPAAGDQRRTV